MTRHSRRRDDSDITALLRAARWMLAYTEALAEGRPVLLLSTHARKGQLRLWSNLK